jgi:hypothetical protein
MLASGWLKVGSFGGCICTRVDFLAATVPGIRGLILFCGGRGGVYKHVRFWLAQGWEFQ